MMAATSTRNREIDDALRKIAEEVGAAIVFETRRGCHRRVRFTYNGKSRFDVLSNTPSSSGVIHSARRQAKRTLRSMGAPT
jgi:hypothetical protein